MTVDDLLGRARSRLDRLDAGQANAVVADGALLVDIRADSRRASDGVVPGSQYVPRNVLEWRLDPAGDHRDPDLARPDAHVIVMCDEGYQSSLAADLDGGFQAWRAAGLPVEPA